MIAFVAATLLYLVVINLKTYRAFAADKQCAIDKAPRTPEATLLRYARHGGWIGAKIAQQKLRHKSYKQPFGSQLNTIGARQGASVLVFVTVIGALAVAPVADPFTPLIPTAAAAPPEAPHAGAPPAISPRPPAARPAGW